MPLEIPAEDPFLHRHLGPRARDVQAMLATVGASSLDELIDQTVPSAIRSDRALDLAPAATEARAQEMMAEMAAANQVFRSYLGMGYNDTITPPVILRNVLENPGWYTAYTPYQPEIAQGRLEALLLFQTMVQELTGMEIANASLLDEATAAAEAMTLAHRALRGKRDVFWVAEDCHPQTIVLVQTRAEPLGIEVRVCAHEDFEVDGTCFGALVQYPATDGGVHAYGGLAEDLHGHKAMLVVAADLLSLALLQAPGGFGADVVVGSSQRFGVPLGYGGPHAAFMATSEAHKRQMPGRIIGISRDTAGRPALRMAMQTREQHIRRQKATSNICTAQVLLAVVAAMYGVWHGPEGIRRIARRIHGQARLLAAGAQAVGHRLVHPVFFDTVCLDVGPHQAEILASALARKINLRALGSQRISIALDESVGPADVQDLLEILGCGHSLERLGANLAEHAIPAAQRRTRPFMGHESFHLYRSETEMLRYLHRLESRDLTLNTSMIPLGSCTMKLNATTEMIPVTWRGFGGVHPFVPLDQAQGYAQLFHRLEAQLAEITGFDAVSLQPNAGSQGEYAGLLAIRSWQRARGQGHRNVCLIPASAHGTNPASAVMAGMRVVVVACDDQGNIDVADLQAKAAAHDGALAALMVTYPSTHGVFEESIRTICDVVHQHGGQVYMDGANLNAMVGLCRPGEFGADVCHLNLHKTFCIPHGGGGPGMGPIGVRAHLAPHLPGHPVVEGVGGEDTLGTISAAPWGSPSILPISWAYIEMMGGPGLTQASQVAILNANYMAHRLGEHYPVLYTGAHGRVAHECILDLRQFKSAGVSNEDVAKRLMDFGFHAPTMSFPVPGTLMVEPTESEGKEELDRFCDAMIAIRAEIQAVLDGQISATDSPLHHAPHALADVVSSDWDRAYTREQAAFPAPWTRQHKFWPVVSRIDNVWGDRNLFCSCDGWAAVEGATQGQ